MNQTGATLVVGPAWVGDMVMAQTLFKTLKSHHPERPIDVLAPPWTHPLLARMPEIRQGIAMPLGHGQFGLTTRYRLGRRLKGHYQQAIILPNALKAALVPFFAATPQRTGFLGEMRFGLLNDIRPLDKRRLPRTVDRFITLGQPANTPLPTPFPLPELQASASDGAEIIARHGLHDPQAPLLVLAPGAEYGPAKRWPLEHFITLAQTMAKAGWQIALLGSPKEQSLGETIIAPIANRGVNLAGKISLTEAVDVMAKATAVVTNDSGLMHVAAALNRPGVAIFGSSDPNHTPPLGKTLTILSLNMTCAPCFKRECPTGSYDCLNRITPEMVRNAL